MSKIQPNIKGVAFNATKGRFHAVLYWTLDNIFYVFALTNQEF